MTDRSMEQDRRAGERERGNEARDGHGGARESARSANDRVISDMSGTGEAPARARLTFAQTGGSDPISLALGKVRGIGHAVMIEHTLFSLPLAVVAFLTESGGRPGWRVSLLILAAVFGARNAANALNRLIDSEIDAANPRTANRDLPSGRVSKKALLAFTVFCGLLFLGSAALLNPLCLALVPVAAILIGGYSFTKRFTWLCHWWLGVTCSSAVMGSFLALAGRFEFRFFPLTAGAALWIAGFDVIYATADEAHDTANGIHSAPARFGRRGALALSALSHLGAAFFFALSGLFYGAGPLYYAGVAVAAGILVAEQILARSGRDGSIPLAAYTLNQILSPVFMAFAVLDVYTRW